MTFLDDVDNPFLDDVSTFLDDVDNPERWHKVNLRSDGAEM